MNSSHEPRVSKQGRTTQLSYQLPNRIHCVKVYPIKARNGSTIILYGHSNGLKIIWRGGRPLKRGTTTTDEKSQARGKGDQATDSRNEKLLPDAAFEEDGEALDNTQSFQTFVQELNLALGVEVLTIAVPTLPSQWHTGASTPNIFARNMVISLACGDSSVKILSIPLEAPSNATKQKLSKLTPDKYAAIAQLPAGPKGHQSPPLHLSLTWTSRDTTQSTNLEQTQDPDWDLLLASSSHDRSGILLVTRIPLVNDNGRHVLKSGFHTPFQRQCLSSSPVSIAFNPTSYPSKRHTQLLVAEHNGSTRIYDPFSSSRMGGSQDSMLGVQGTSSGTWIANFATPYKWAATDLTSAGLARRKPILAAQWASKGQCLLVLTADGDFALWDANGTDASTLNDLKILASVAPSSQSSSTQASSRSRGPRSGLAPMTPNTRAAKAERLFSSTSPTPTSLAPRGGLSVMTRGTSDGDESVTLWYCGYIHCIPNFQAFRKRASDGARSAGSLYGPGLSQLEGLNLQGEEISSVSQLPFPDASRESHSQPDVVVSADSRLVILCKQITSSLFAGSSALVPRDEDEEMADEDDFRNEMDLLGREELGLAGIDKMADSMSGSRLFSKSAGRKVLFAAS